MENKSVNKLCCDEMNKAVFTENIIEYDCRFREYVIEINKKSVRVLHYCPFCGTKLPKELITEFYNILEDEYNFDLDNLDFPDFKNAPLEMQSDEWWKKRGL